MRFRMNNLEKIRLNFLPEPVKTLFVGESPPNGGTFFYNADSRLYRTVKESFEEFFGANENFLEEFKRRGFFLDDLVLSPVNQIKKKKERDERLWECVPLLARRLMRYRPSAVVVLMLAIKPMVRDAMCAAGLSQVPFYDTPFPGPWHQKRFKEKMREILPKLPTTRDSGEST